jgi:hypothetical protein
VAEDFFITPPPSSTTFVELITITDNGGLPLIQRDLYDPAQITDLKSLASSARLLIRQYTYYSRDFNSNTLAAIGFSDVVDNLASVVAVHSAVTAHVLRLAMTHIGSHREILPARM